MSQRESLIRAWARDRYGQDWEQRMSMGKVTEDWLVAKAEREGRLIRAKRPVRSVSTVPS